MTEYFTNNMFNYISPMLDDFELYRAYVNMFRRSDHPRPHADAAHSDHVTLLYYANSEWKRSWGGETVFFDTRGQEIVQSVLPKPGRVAVFSGSVAHSARPPLPDVDWPRLTVALKWRSTVSDMGIGDAGADKEL